MSQNNYEIKSKVFAASDVKKLREITGMGIMDCKRALELHNGDTNAAIKYFRANLGSRNRLEERYVEHYGQSFLEATRKVEEAHGDFLDAMKALSETYPLLDKCMSWNISNDSRLMQVCCTDDEII